MTSASFRFGLLWHSIGYLLVALIIYMSLASDPVGIYITQNDKVAHGFAYAVLMGWFVQLYARTRQRVLLAVAFTTLGIVIEFLQSLHPIRYFDVADMFANTTGVVVAWVMGSGALGSLLIRVDAFLSETVSSKWEQ